MATIIYKTRNLKDYVKPQFIEGILGKAKQISSLSTSEAELGGREVLYVSGDDYLKGKKKYDRYKRSFLFSLVYKIESDSASSKKTEITFTEKDLVFPRGRESIHKFSSTEHKEEHIYNEWKEVAAFHSFLAFRKILPTPRGGEDFLNITSYISAYIVLPLSALLSGIATLISTPFTWLADLRRGNTTFDSIKPTDSGLIILGKGILNFGRLCGIAVSPLLWCIAQPIYAVSHILSSTWILLDAIGNFFVKALSLMTGNSQKYPDFKDIFAMAAKQIIYLGLVTATLALFAIPIVGQVFAGIAGLNLAGAFFASIGLAGAVGGAIQLVSSLYSKASKWVLNKILIKTPENEPSTPTEVELSRSSNSKVPNTLRHLRRLDNTKTKERTPSPTKDNSRSDSPPILQSSHRSSMFSPIKPDEVQNDSKEPEQRKTPESGPSSSS